MFVQYNCYIYELYKQTSIEYAYYIMLKDSDSSYHKLLSKIFQLMTRCMSGVYVNMNFSMLLFHRATHDLHNSFGQGKIYF